MEFTRPQQDPTNIFFINIIFILFIYKSIWCKRNSSRHWSGKSCFVAESALVMLHRDVTEESRFMTGSRGSRLSLSLLSERPPALSQLSVDLLQIVDKVIEVLLFLLVLVVFLAGFICGYIYKLLKNKVSNDKS